MYTLIAGNLSKKFNREIIINKDLEKYYVNKKPKILSKEKFSPQINTLRLNLACLRI